jgi:hypothetical protein
MKLVLINITSTDQKRKLIPILSHHFDIGSGEPESRLKPTRKKNEP